MNDSHPVATRYLIAVAPDGRKFPITLAIGQPYEIDATEWACPVLLDGLHSKLHDQHGVDSWQAMQLAYQLVAQLLGYFEKEGGVLLWPDTKERATVDELLPRAVS